MKAWNTVIRDVIVHSFKACRISSSTGGSEDGFPHCRKPGGVAHRDGFLHCLKPGGVAQSDGFLHCLKPGGVAHSDGFLHCLKPGGVAHSGGFIYCLKMIPQCWLHSLSEDDPTVMVSFTV